VTTSFGGGSALSHITKEAAANSDELHSLLSTSLDTPFWSPEWRRLAVSLT